MSIENEKMKKMRGQNVFPGYGLHDSRNVLLIEHHFMMIWSNLYVCFFSTLSLPLVRT